jgi:hypothetical protein
VASRTLTITNGVTELLVSDERSKSIWKQCVRRAGVPDQHRARFWRYLMYGNVPWLPVSAEDEQEGGGGGREQQGGSDL